MASVLDNFYDINPVNHIDQNQWDEKIAELSLQFRMNQQIIYTPLIDWAGADSQMNNGARTTIWTEMLEGDVNVDPIDGMANYIGVTTSYDTRQRSLSTVRYADKVQLHESQNLYQRFIFNGTRDWRVLLRASLGNNVIRKHEILSRNSFFLQPKEFWTFAGNATSFNDLGSDDVFSPNILNAWHLRIGNTGSPVVPGVVSSVKYAYIPPSATFDFQEKIAIASQNETSMWRDAQLYAGRELRYELGMMKNVRFIEVPNNSYGENLNILYNCGAITVQAGVISPIKTGDGAPDPEDATFKVDDVWSVGQKNVTHYIQLKAGTDMTKFALRDIVTIHTARTSYFGVTNGVDFRKGDTITRRIVKIDAINCRIAFDRPVLFDYTNPFMSDTDTFYAYVTKGKHVGFALVLGSRGGIKGKIDRPIKFYEPKPVDDFESVWRFLWDAWEGYNLWDPNLFELHFFSVTLPKPGGLITP